MVNSVKLYSLRALVRIRARVSFFRSDIVLMFLVHHRGITAHMVWLFSFVTLTQVNFFPASLLRHCCVRSPSRSYDPDFPRPHSRFLSRSRGKKKKSQKKRKFSSTSSPSSYHSSFSSFRERERKWYKSKEETH